MHDSPPAPARGHDHGIARGLAFDGQARFLLVRADAPAQETARRHGLSGSAALIAAEGLVSTALLGAHVKGEERITVQVQTEGDRLSYMGELREGGLIRARFRPSRLGPPHTLRGQMLTIRSLGARELYRGISAIEDESFGTALQRHVHESTQVDVRVSVEARLAADGTPTRAWGLLLERLPETDAESFARWASVTIGQSVDDLDAELALGRLGGTAVEVLEAGPLTFSCTCSRDRVLGTLQALGAEDLSRLLAEQGQAEACCHFCAEVYIVDGPALSELIERLDHS